MEINIYKDRSLTACFHEAYQFIVKNIWTLLKRTWTAALPVAVLCAITFWFRLPDKALHDWGQANAMTSWAIQTAVYVALLAASVVWGARIWQLFNGQAFRPTLWRMLKWNVVMTIIGFIIFFLAGMTLGYCTAATAHKTMTAATAGLIETATLALAGLLVVVLAPALTFAESCYMMDFGTGLRHPGTLLSRGFRHWGRFFTALFISLIIVAIAALVAYLPFMVLATAQTVAQLGALDGDPLGTPAAFPALVMAVGTLSTFVFCYIGVWFYALMAYLYGASDTRDKNKNQLKINTEQ